MARTGRVLTDEIWFGEGPRWHDGRLWFGDWAELAVRSISPNGTLRTEVAVGDCRPSGMGWAPNGDLLYVAMEKQQVRRVAADGPVSLHADLSQLSTWLWNDMVVDREGRAFVGEFGFDFNAEMDARGIASVVADHPTAKLACVQPDGSTSLADGDMHFPNGSVITPDGKTLIVAETLARRLTAFDIGADGALSNSATGPSSAGACRTASASTPRALSGSPTRRDGLVRVAEGGEVLEVIDTVQPCFACMLGGETGRTLFMLTAPWTPPGGVPEKGRILTAEVDAPHAGCP